VKGNLGNQISIRKGLAFDLHWSFSFKGSRKEIIFEKGETGINGGKKILAQREGKIQHSRVVTTIPITSGSRSPAGENRFKDAKGG